MTSGVERRSFGALLRRQPAPEHPPVVPVGRPPRWAVLGALLVTAAVTVDLLAGGVVERLDSWISDAVSSWGLRDADATYWPLWIVTQIGGRGTVLVVLAGLIGWLAVRQRSLLPLLRILLALALLSAVVYGMKYGMGRTAPVHPAEVLHHPDGQSFPSGHAANAVLLWGVACWQAVQFGLFPVVQRLFRALATAGPVLCALAMIALDFHWVSDAVVGAAVGVVLLGVVHAVDGWVLARWTGAGAGRPSS